MKEIIEDLKWQIAECKRGLENLNNSDWLDGDGVLMTANEAQRIVDALEVALQPYEPYHGVGTMFVEGCDVEGCKDEACGGGTAWNDTGYWRACYKHADDDRKGKPQPKMKQASIDRENSRDKTTGYLPPGGVEK